MQNRTVEISDSARTALSAIIACESTNFSKLVCVAGLSKAEDFRGVNLSGVDFSHSDLRGFDFTDADLSGTHGINFKIDGTTILTGANVTSSVLAYEKERRDYFSANPEHLQLYQRLMKEYWSNGAIWIGENLRRDSKNYEACATIAKYLYGSVKDQTYKNQILYGIRHTFKTADEYKSFLLDQIRDPDITNRSLRGIIDILSRLYYTDTSVRNMILLYLGHENKEIRKLCVRPVLAPRFYQQNREAIIGHMETETDGGIRRLYSECFCRTTSYDPEVLFRADERAFHDYADPVDNRVFETLVRGKARREKAQHRSPNFGKSEGIAIAEVKNRDLYEASSSVDTIVRNLMNFGLPLKLEYSILEFRREFFDRTWIDRPSL